jgi:hypothetical protein
MKRGYRLLGDDHLIVEPGTRPLRVVPALPWLKVLPATARWLGRDPETLPFLHPNSCKRRFDLPFDSIARNSLPLRRLYVLRRSADAARPTVRPLVAAEAMAAVIRHSYLPRTMAAARLDVGRLATLAQMCDQGVAELTYPDGWEAIGDAISAVTDEI